MNLWQTLRQLFTPEAKSIDRAEVSNKNSIYFHEDDQQMIELLPKGHGTLYECAITLSELDASIQQLDLSKTTNIFTGYGQTYRTPIANHVAYYKDYAAIYIEPKDQSVQNIWLTSPHSFDHTQLAQLLHAWGSKWGLNLHDHFTESTVDLNNAQAISNYLKKV